ncbi:hypothetical protein I0C86_40105 [Plantactinospora sp. S1510]|uniref:ANTAR domain-containing protein n=1 Tax=Plantactinospora alkalitolerans TaxID=2789879 RepID=A0ABS0HAA0_9ACTN|nr:hypothetical protein [Plantactinospora alkalitolerans]MBF9135084.1 hypothetical protein [Plantactinospora alkalitolerans]
MSVGDVKTTVRRGTQTISEARRAAEAVGVESTDAISLARHTVHDSRHAEVEKALACLREAAHELELTARRLQVSAEAANEYLMALG